MKAIVLTFDRHRAITQHLILQYERIWPDHPFHFRIPYQQLRGPDSERVEYVESPPEIAATVLRLLQDIEDEEWVYWCSDDKYPIHFIVEKVTELLQYVLTTPEISGLLFCRARATLDRPDLALHSRQLVTPAGDILLERKGWYQIWIHQFLKAKVLRSLFSQLPLKIPSAKALDGLKDQIPKPDEYHLFVTEQNFAVFGESTKRGVITRNCLESIRQTDIQLPEWFQRSNGEWSRWVDCLRIPYGKDFAAGYQGINNHAKSAGNDFLTRVIICGKSGDHFPRTMIEQQVGPVNAIGSRLRPS